MQHGTKKRKIIYIVAAAGLALLALIALVAVLVLRSHSEPKEPEATASPVPAATAAPEPDTVLVAGKAVDPATDSFDLSGKVLSEQDREEIASLSGLTTLSLTNCGVSDLGFVSGLSGLRTLYLPDNRINDLTPLTGLPELRTVYLDRNPLTDLTPLTSLPQLTTVSLKGVTIPEYVLSDLMAAMPDCRFFTDSVVEEARPVSLGGAAFTEDVETLDLSSRGITDISRLSRCLQLRELDLSGNPLESLTTLSGLPKLTKLTLRETGLTDDSLAFLGTLQRLTYLDVRDNAALTAQGLETLRLNLPGCQVVHDTVYFTLNLGGQRLSSDMTEASVVSSGVVSLSGLERFAELRRLDLSGNAVADIGPLRELYGLEELILAYNAVGDLSALSGHTALRKLDLSHNEIRDVYPLAGCTGLTELDLSWNQITYLSHLNTCTALRRLDLTGNPGLEPDQIRRLQEALPACSIITDLDMSMPEPTPVPPEPVPDTPAPEAEVPAVIPEYPTQG